MAVPVLLKEKSRHIPGSHTEILSSAAAVGSVFAELFMIQSLLVFDPAVCRVPDEQPASPMYNRRAVSPSRHPLTIAAWSHVWMYFYPHMHVYNMKRMHR